MAQGIWLSVLARGYQEFPELRPKILEFGQKLISPLYKTVEQGGLAYNIYINSKKYRFLAEYPVPDYSPLTLNGFMFTLIGLKEYHAITQTPQSLELLNEGLITLESILPFYDTRPVSLYDLSYITKPGTEPLVKLSYHKIHSNQLDFLFKHVKPSKLFHCISNSMRAKSVNLKTMDDLKGKIRNPGILEKGTVLRLDQQCSAYYAHPPETYQNVDICLGMACKDKSIFIRTQKWLRKAWGNLKN